MTDEQMIEALENLRLQTRRALAASEGLDDGYLAAVVDVATLASTLLEILRGANQVGDGSQAVVLKDLVRSEIRIMATMRGWSA